FDGASFVGAKLLGTHMGQAHLRGATLDDHWTREVDPRTFEEPPIGEPFIYLGDDSVLSPGQPGYPKLKQQYRQALKGYDESTYPHPTFYGSFELGDEVEDAFEADDSEDDNS